jgi:sulfide:quinone oxidoreductase
MKALVLGGGFGGIVAAHSLRNELGEEHEVTLVSRDGDFYLRAAFPRLAFEGETAPDEIRLPLGEALPARGIGFKRASVTAIRPESNTVETSDGEIGYDYLIIALGTRYADEKVEGLKEHSHSLWTVDGAQRLQEQLKDFDGGSFVTGAAPASPCEGPTWEAVLHMDHLARERGIRDRVEIHLFTTKPVALQPVGPAGHRWAEETFGRLGVQVHTDAELIEVTEEKVVFEDGRELRADVPLIMAPYEGHDVVKQAGLGDEVGFVPVDSHMRSESHRNVFAIGDAVSMPQKPKMAHNAMRGAQVAAANIASEVSGGEADRELHYELMCVIENGEGRGTYARSDAPWGGDLSVVMGGHSDNPGLSAEEAHFIKKSFGDHFLSTGGNVRYIM